ncbi:hypothetical protein Pcinc_037463 [Petrolisthes cinctipes]|uniref:Uncharacterized protein n=1 Tax=Petrolisthes cinctipes TaxID=88211 RepID=A0AAE1BTG3_PETCI|nr:hypothetical protein Pcinc_037463 [Petrolisthes cinctipes]
MTNLGETSPGENSGGVTCVTKNLLMVGEGVWWVRGERCHARKPLYARPHAHNAQTVITYSWCSQSSLLAALHNESEASQRASGREINRRGKRAQFATTAAGTTM